MQCRRQFQICLFKLNSTCKVPTEAGCFVLMIPLAAFPPFPLSSLSGMHLRPNRLTFTLTLEHHMRFHSALPYPSTVNMPQPGLKFCKWLTCVFQSKFKPTTNTKRFSQFGLCFYLFWPYLSFLLVLVQYLYSDK